MPSQANRVEELLLRALREERLHIPSISIQHKDITLSSLEAPHRYADAYLRDSTIEGTDAVGVFSVPRAERRRIPGRNFAGVLAPVSG